MKETEASKISPLLTVSLVIVLAGITLRSIQFFVSPSMFEDEIALITAINRASWLDIMLGHLGQYQVAPVGFAAVEKVLRELGGRNDLILRIPSFLASVAALCLAPFLLRKLLKPTWAAVALAGLAFSPPLIHFSGVLKQYSGDVFVSIGLTIILLSLLEKVDKRTSRLAWICGLSVLFSSTAAFICGAGMAALILRHWRQSLPRAVWVNLGIGLLLLPLILGLHATMGVSDGTKEYMAVFWQGQLMPPLLGYPSWILEQARSLIPSLFFGLYMVPQPWLSQLGWMYLPILAVAGLGFLSQLRSKPAHAVLIAGPFLLALAASRMDAFPILQRTCLFIIPQLVVLTLWGMSALFSKGPRIVQLPTALLLGAMLIAPTLKNPPPHRAAYYEDLVVSVRGQAEPGDKFWVHEMSGWIWGFYARGVPRGDVRYGRCARGDLRRQLRDVDRLRGEGRVWLVFGRVLPRFLPEAEAVLDYLRTIGIQEQEIHVGGSESAANAVFRFDLSDETRLGAADAESFPIGDPIPVPPQYSCPRE